MQTFGYGYLGIVSFIQGCELWVLYYSPEVGDPGCCIWGFVRHIVFCTDGCHSCIMD